MTRRCTGRSKSRAGEQIVECQKKDVDMNYTNNYTIYKLKGITHGKYKDCNIDRQTII